VRYQLKDFPMIRFYFPPSPNPAKIALFLEETGLPYEVIPLDTTRGEQHLRDFRAINPNGKMPAIMDTEGPGRKAVRVPEAHTIPASMAVSTANVRSRTAIFERMLDA
jgi:GST-like protein